MPSTISSQDLPPLAPFPSRCKTLPLFEASPEPYGLPRSVSPVCSRPPDLFTDNEVEDVSETEMESDKVRNSKEPVLVTSVDRPNEDTSRVETMFFAVSLDEKKAEPSVQPPHQKTQAQIRREGRTKRSTHTRRPWTLTGQARKKIKVKITPMAD